MRLFRLCRMIFFPILVLVLFVAIIPSVHAATLVKEKRLLVKFQQNVDKKAIAAKHGAKILSEIPKLNVAVLQSSDGALREKLQKEKIDYIEEDAVATTLSNDPLYTSQWALPKIQWDKLISSSSAYNISSPSALIAVVDTGVDYTHPDLVGKVDTTNDFDFVNNDTDAMDDNLHGTHVAGIAAAATDNTTGVAGVSFNTVKILPIKVLDAGGSGYYSWIASGIIYAADHGAKVINLSLGGSFNSTTLENAVNYAWNKGAVVVAAAGNSGTTAKSYPGAYTNAIGVWASTQTDYRASFSTYGSWVDVGAPGVSILSTLPFTKDTTDGVQDGYTLLSGTSMATPHVAGLAGLLFSQHPSWTATQTRNKIQSTADSVPDREFSRGRLGSGRINVYRALTQ